MGDGQHEAPSRGFWMASGFYDALKWFALVVLPAFGAAYFSLADLWELPKAAEVVGTVTIVGTFLGGVLRFSHNSYEKSDAKYDGVVRVFPDEESGTTLVNPLLDPRALSTKKELTVKVEHVT